MLGAGMGPGHAVRRVMTIARDTEGVLSATVYSIDETDDPLPVSTISLNGSTLKLSLDVNRGEWRNYHRTYCGTVSADGKSILGPHRKGDPHWQRRPLRLYLKPR